MTESATPVRPGSIMYYADARNREKLQRKICGKFDDNVKLAARWVKGGGGGGWRGGGRWNELTAQKFIEDDVESRTKIASIAAEVIM